MGREEGADGKGEVTGELEVLPEIEAMFPEVASQNTGVVVVDSSLEHAAGSPSKNSFVDPIETLQLVPTHRDQAGLARRRSRCIHGERPARRLVVRDSGGPLRVGDDLDGVAELVTIQAGRRLEEGLARIDEPPGQADGATVLAGVAGGTEADQDMPVGGATDQAEHAIANAIVDITHELAADLGLREALVQQEPADAFRSVPGQPPAPELGVRQRLEALDESEEGHQAVGLGEVDVLALGVLRFRYWDELEK